MVQIDNYVEDWTLTREYVEGRQTAIARVQLNSAGVSALAGLYLYDRVYFSMTRWTLVEKAGATWTLAAL